MGANWREDQVDPSFVLSPCSDRPEGFEQVQLWERPQRDKLSGSCEIGGHGEVSVLREAIPVSLVCNGRDKQQGKRSHIGPTQGSGAAFLGGLVKLGGFSIRGRSGGSRDDHTWVRSKTDSRGGERTP
ncbi:hypothetical protein L1987_11177 [Smallanthus sonchifolius]|uniref:Uncharacterized protein n=1 Tax=Smallanthus sonchifolius TaxID=185202 RepID=A0ACB9JAK7_9ASTR|nr:hypothetical protein L1987_11177 [Smallanthus sonchifolius]